MQIRNPLFCEMSLEIGVPVRRNLQSMATQDQLQIAANAMEPPMTVQQYKDSMSCSEWGDNLMVALLAKAFTKDICVISSVGTRTFYADGREENTVEPSALWIAHEGEFHYYGVIRGGAEDSQCVLVPSRPKRTRLRSKTPPPAGECAHASAAGDTGTVVVKQKPQARQGMKVSGVKGAEDAAKRRLCGNCGVCLGFSELFFDF